MKSVPYLAQKAVRVLCVFFGQGCILCCCVCLSWSFLNKIYFFFLLSHFFVAVYKVCEYKAIPCVILLVDGIVSYVGSPRDEFKAALEVALKKDENIEVEVKEEEKETVTINVSEKKVEVEEQQVEVVVTAKEA